MNLERFAPALAALALAAGTAAAAPGLLPGKKPDFLPVDEAFAIQPLERRDGTLRVSWRIAKDYYLYRDRLSFALREPRGATLGTPALPQSEPYEDEHFGSTQVYRGTLVVALPLATAANGPVSLTVGYQGCADAGLCYPPQTRTLELEAAR
jgi:thioredoxin:protein disulfide reductase